MHNIRFSYMPPTCESMKMTHTKIRTFRIKHKGYSAIVPVGCNCLMELFLCSYPEGIQYPQDIFVVSIVVLFLWSSRSPIWFLLYKLMRVSLILHRWCSFVLVLIRVFLRRCRSLSIVLCPAVLSSVFPIFDMFLRCTRTCYIHMGFCSIHRVYHLTGSWLLMWDLWLFFDFCSQLRIHVLSQSFWTVEWRWWCFLLLRYLFGTIDHWICCPKFFPPKLENLSQFFSPKVFGT